MADTLAEPNAEITDARAYIGDDHPRFYANFIERCLGQFLDFALGSLQPVGSANAHDIRDSPCR